MTREKLIAEIMRECEKDGEPVTEEEAAEMADMEIKARGIKHYEKSDKPRKPTTRERKVDETKLRILRACRFYVEGIGATVIAEKTETEISFTYNDETFTLKLIKHRPPKNWTCGRRKMKHRTRPSGRVRLFFETFLLPKKYQIETAGTFHFETFHL